MGIQETTENKTDKFSLLWIAFRSPSVCGWVFGEDNQQVNSEFSEKKTKKQKKQKKWLCKTTAAAFSKKRGGDGLG